MMEEGTDKQTSLLIKCLDLKLIVTTEVAAGGTWHNMDVTCLDLDVVPSVSSGTLGDMKIKFYKSEICMKVFNDGSDECG